MRTDTFRFLKGHPAQLRDYKLFLIVGITAMFLGVGIMGYTVRFFPPWEFNLQLFGGL
jgi:hypothetical protein